MGEKRSAIAAFMKRMGKREANPCYPMNRVIHSHEAMYDLADELKHVMIVWADFLEANPDVIDALIEHEEEFFAEGTMAVDAMISEA